MKKLATTLSATVAAMLPAATAFAASGAREDNIGFFAWVFMGFCGVIILGQFIPAIMMMLGMVKGLKKGEEAKRAV
jgi:urea transporter